jgi:hypothetical protein
VQRNQARQKVPSKLRCARIIAGAVKDGHTLQFINRIYSWFLLSGCLPAFDLAA